MAANRLPSLDLRLKAPRAMEMIDNMSVLSPEQVYAIDYLTCRIVDIKRPDVANYNLGPNVAEAIRDFVDERLS